MRKLGSRSLCSINLYIFFNITGLFQNIFLAYKYRYIIEIVNLLNYINSCHKLRIVTKVRMWYKCHGSSSSLSLIPSGLGPLWLSTVSYLCKFCPIFKMYDFKFTRVDSSVPFVTEIILACTSDILLNSMQASVLVSLFQLHIIVTTNNVSAKRLRVGSIWILTKYVSIVEKTCYINCFYVN